MKDNLRRYQGEGCSRSPTGVKAALLVVDIAAFGAYRVWNVELSDCMDVSVRP